MKQIKTIGKDLDHTKTKLFQKYGSTEKTVDPDFEEQRKNLEDTSKSLAAIYKDIGKQDEAIKNLSAPLLPISESISSFYEDQANGEKFRNSVMSLDMAVREYLEKQKELYFNIEEAIGKLNAAKKKVKQRDNILLDYDKRKTEVIKLNANPAKDPAKLATAEKKFDEFKELYTKTNEELLEELTILHNTKYSSFLNDYKLLVNSQLDLFASASEAFKGLVSQDDYNVQPAPKRPVPSPVEEEQSSQGSVPRRESFSRIDSDSASQPPLPALPKKEPEPVSFNTPGLPSLPKKEPEPVSFNAPGLPALPKKDPEPVSFNAPGLPALPKKEPEPVSFGSGPPPTLPKKDLDLNTPPQRPLPSPGPKKGGAINNMASDAVSNAALDKDNQKKVGAAIGKQAEDRENQQKVGEKVANSTDNKFAQAIAKNSGVQKLTGKFLSKASNNEAVQQKVGEKVAEESKNEEHKQAVGSSLKAGFKNAFKKG